MTLEKLHPGSVIWTPSSEQFRQLAFLSPNFTAFAERLAILLGKKPKALTGGTTYKALKCRVEHEGLSYYFSQGKPRRCELPIADLTDRASVRYRILRDDLLPYLCEGCDNKGEWMGQPLTLHLDHRDGDCSNHELENLRFLCPNCHSQTETYAGRNTGRQREKRTSTENSC